MNSSLKLVAVSLLALSCVGITGLTGCSAPAAPDSGLGDEEDPNASDSADTAKLPPKKTTPTKSTPAPAPAADPTPAPTNPTTPTPTTPTPTTPVPGGDPQACMDQCAAGGPAAQYWSCSANCKDQACDDNCWNPTCGNNSQACENALNACDAQCGAGGP
jgi:hypothetical protein